MASIMAAARGRSSLPGRDPERVERPVTVDRDRHPVRRDAPRVPGHHPGGSPRPGRAGCDRRPPGAAIAGTNAALDEHQAWLRDDVMPRSDQWLAGPEQFEEMVRLAPGGSRRDPGRRRGDAGPGPRAAERGLRRDRPVAATTRSRTGSRTTTCPPSRPRWTSTGGPWTGRLVVEHDLATLPPNDNLVVIETPSFIRHLVPFAAYFDPARFDTNAQGRTSSPRRRRRR